LVRPAGDAVLATALRQSDSSEAALGAVLTLARKDSIAETRVAGEGVRRS